MNFFKNRPLATVLFFFNMIAFSAVSFSFSVKIRISLILFALSAVTVISAVAEKLKYGRKISALYPSVMLAVSLSLTLSAININAATDKICGSNKTVTATVHTVLYEYGNIQGLGIKTETINGKKTDVNLLLENESGYFLEIGDKIGFGSDIVPLGDSDADFDEKSYYMPKGYKARTTVTDGIEVFSKGNKDFYISISDLRTDLSDRICDDIDGESGKLMCAISLGERHLLSKNTVLNFRICGISHILALSGMHLSVLSMFLSFLLNRTKLKKKRKIFFTLSFILLYTVITGASSSVVRSAIMATITSLAFLIGRRYDSLTALMISVAVILTINPASACDIGLMLSYSATFGIIFTLSFYKPASRNKIRSYLFMSLVMWLGASVFTIPITSFSFGTFSVISPITNLIFAPVLQLYLILSVFTLIFGAPGFIGTVFTLSGNLILKFINTFASLDFAYVSVGYPSVKIIIAVSSAVLTVLLFTKISVRRYIACLATCAVILGANGALIKADNMKNNYLSYVSYGRNDYIYLKSNSKSLIIDLSSGGYSNLTSAVSEFEENNIAQIDTYFTIGITARKLDSIEKLSGRIRIRNLIIYLPNGTAEREKYSRLTEICEKNGIKPDIGTDGTFTFGDYTVGCISTDNETFVIMKSKNSTIAYISSDSADAKTLDAVLQKSNILILGASKADSTTAKLAFSQSLESVYVSSYYTQLYSVNGISDFSIRKPTETIKIK